MVALHSEHRCGGGLLASPRSRLRRLRHGKQTRLAVEKYPDMVRWKYAGDKQELPFRS